MTAFNEIRAALESEIANVTGIPSASNRAWENVQFKPTNGTTWVRMTLAPTSSMAAHIGNDPQLEYKGIMRIDVFAPQGNGAASAETLADNIRLAYKPGTALNSGSTTVLVRSSERKAPGLIDGPWFRVSVDITWTTFRK